MMGILKDTDQRRIISWALYDWGNSAYATVVMAGFFPIFFKQYWFSGSEVTESTFFLGLANSVAGLVIVLLAPFLGAVADCGGLKKRFLLLFTTLGITMTAALFLVEQGDWEFAIVLYVMATIGFSGGVTFCDSLLLHVARRERLDRVSALGYALGYLGGGLLFTVNVLMTLYPDSFSLQSASEAVRLSFLMVAIWWATFTIPLILFVEEPATTQHDFASAVISGTRQLLSTFREIKQLKVVFLFLLAYWFYIDGVDTIVRMAVDYGLSLGFASESLIIALLVTQFVGFPAALVFGRIAEKYGPKRGIFFCLSVYCFITIWGVFMEHVYEFYLLAIVIGLVQGGIQSLSRSLYASLIPPDKAAEFFGFYNMLGKFAVIIGPVMMGWVAVITGSSRVSLLSIILLFVLGAGLLRFVDVKAGGQVEVERNS